MTSIVAVCGTMGSGKSTLMEHVRDAMPDCEILFEDDYNRTTERSLSEIEAWWERGGQVDEFDLSALIETLAARCPERGSEAAREKRRSSDRKLILVETHFGKLHSRLRPWIDCQLWVDVPADIAIARKVAQLTFQLQQTEHPGRAGEGLRWIEEFCRGYLSTTRKLFEMQRQQVRGLSDVTIDGLGTPLDVCLRFLESLPEKFRPEI